MLIYTSAKPNLHRRGKLENVGDGVGSDGRAIVMSVALLGERMVAIPNIQRRKCAVLCRRLPGP